jgi:hypothetical protein
MSSNDLSLKLDNLLQNDDTENFYSLISEIIEENKEYVSDLEQNMNTIFNILLNDINESNHERKMSFICLFFEILISENIDFVLYLEKLLNLISKENIYSDENIKRIINICSNATLNKKSLLKKLINFAKNKVEYLYIIFSLVGFKDLIVDDLSDNWEIIFDLMNNQEIKLNSSDIKNVLKCLELLINLSEDKFKPYASSAIYQALDYLSETDIELQKRSLMIIYSLSKFCDEQLQPLKDHIVDFLKVLEKGKNVEINNLCNTMLKHFSGNDENDNEENEYDENGNGNNEENEENENDNENNNIIDNDDYPINKDDQNEQNEDYNEIDNKKNKDIYKSNEEYDSNYERRNEIIDLDKDDEDSRVYNKYNNNKNRIKESKKEIDQRQDDNNQDPNINYSNETKNINNSKKNRYEEKHDEKEESNLENDQIVNNNDEYNNIDIDAIMKKIKDLSYKQIIILNSIEQYKSDTERIINQKKIKIKSLEEKIEDLEEKIRIEKNKRKNKGNKIGRTNYQMRRKNNDNNNNSNSYKNKYEDEDDDYNDYYRYEK